jgi:hypothetical protein
MAVREASGNGHVRVRDDCGQEAEGGGETLVAMFGAAFGDEIGQFLRYVLDAVASRAVTSDGLKGSGRIKDDGNGMGFCCSDTRGESC